MHSPESLCHLNFSHNIYFEISNGIKRKAGDFCQKGKKIFERFRNSILHRERLAFLFISFEAKIRIVGSK